MSVPGTIYLLHFDAPFGHARHYLGWSANLEGRLRHHERGTGATLLRHVADAGISWKLARTWAGDRHLERRLKNRGGHARICPICREGCAHPDGHQSVEMHRVRGHLRTVQVCNLCGEPVRELADLGAYEPRPTGLRQTLPRAA